MLRSGDSVAVDLKAAGAGEQAILEQLQAIGIRIDPGSPNKLVAKVTQGGSSVQNYKNLSGGGSESVTQSTEYFELTLFKSGEKVWYMSSGSSTQDLGSFVVLYEGETLQGRASANRIGTAAFYGSIVLPKEFIKVPEGGFYGKSKGTPDGFEDP